jgi:hypothetical protein
MAVRTIKGILQRRYTEKGEPNHSLTGEGHGRGEESGSQPRWTPRRMGSGMPSQQVRKQERSPGGRWTTTTVSSAISRKVKCSGDAIGEVG